MRNIDPRLEARLKKLYALAKQGVGGEAINAQKLLEDLLAKHDMTLDMLTDTETKKYFFNYKTEFEKDLLFRIVSNIKEESNFSYLQRKGQRKIGFELTAYEYIEVEIQREAYTESWRKYLEQAQSAFIVANRLTYYSSGDRQPRDDKPLTPEEQAEIQRILLMSVGVPDPNFKRNLLENRA